MKHWTIKKRIIMGFATVLILSAVMGVTAVVAIHRINDHVSAITDDAIPGIVSAGNIRSIVSDAQSAIIREIQAKTPEEKAHWLQAISDYGTNVVAEFTKLEKITTRPEAKAEFEKLKEARQAYVQGRDQILEASRDGRTEDAVKLEQAFSAAAYANYLKQANAFFDECMRYGDASSKSIQTSVRGANWTTGALSIVSIVAGSLFAVVIIAGLGRVLNRVANSLDEGANEITSAAAQVATAGQTLAQGASEQAASLEETSASLEEISSMTKRNAENAEHAKQLAGQTRTAADTGANDMQEMTAAMDAIKTSSDNIGKIIKTIDEIAFQTNILALNAAVEAARAGEAGMGFAVVADEVRNLAQRSAQAAKETAEKIEDSIRKSENGVQISSRVATGLQEIVEKARKVDELVAEIAAASKEQNQGITQVNTAVSEMDKVTQANAAGAEESASAAEEMSAQSEVLKEAVGELLKLVGGTSQARPVAFKPAAAAVKAKATAVTKPASGNGSNGHNGHKRAMTPAAAPVPAQVGDARKRAELPMDGDFTEF